MRFKEPRPSWQKYKCCYVSYNKGRVRITTSGPLGELALDRRSVRTAWSRQSRLRGLVNVVVTLKKTILFFPLFLWFSFRRWPSGSVGGRLSGVADWTSVRWTATLRVCSEPRVLSLARPSVWVDGAASWLTVTRPGGRNSLWPSTWMWRSIVLGLWERSTDMHVQRDSGVGGHTCMWSGNRTAWRRELAMTVDVNVALTTIVVFTTSMASRNRRRQYPPPLVQARVR